MQLSPVKIRQLESIALKLKVNPDLLLDALLDIGLKKRSKKEEKVIKLTPQQKVKAIEEEALNKGWTYEQLWKMPKYKNYSEMSLICFLDDYTTIGEVTEKYIVLLHERPVGGPVINNFYNILVEQPWITKTHGNSHTSNYNILNANELVADVEMVNTKNEVSKIW